MARVYRLASSHACSDHNQSNRGRLGHGYGLAIARELAELAPATKGVNFELKLAAFISVLPRNGRRYFGLAAAL
jgi:hypothetical protein